MANQLRLFKPHPLTKDDLQSTHFPLPVPEDVLQLQADTINVLEGKVEIESFPLDYQKKIRSYYRFSAVRQNSKSNNIAHRTCETLDIV